MPNKDRQIQVLEKLIIYTILRHRRKDLSRRPIPTAGFRRYPLFNEAARVRLPIRRFSTAMFCGDAICRLIDSGKKCLLQQLVEKLALNRLFKMSRCKARKSPPAKGTARSASCIEVCRMTRLAAQRDRWAFFNSLLEQLRRFDRHEVGPGSFIRRVRFPTAPSSAFPILLLWRILLEVFSA